MVTLVTVPIVTRGSGAADARALGREFPGRTVAPVSMMAPASLLGQVQVHHSAQKKISRSGVHLLSCSCTCRFGAGASGRSKRVGSYAVRASGCTKRVAWLPEEEQYHLPSQSEKRADGHTKPGRAGPNVAFQEALGPVSLKPKAALDSAPRAPRFGQHVACL